MRGKTTSLQTIESRLFSLQFRNSPTNPGANAVNFDTFEQKWCILVNKRPDKKSNVRSDGSNQLAAWRWLTMELFGLIRQFGSHVIWAGVGLYLIHESADTIRAFVGHTSVANLVVSIAAHLNVVIVGSLTLSGVATGAWALEYRRHRKTRERLTARITALEMRVDPNRTSSLLTTEGTTRSGDQ